VEEAADETGLGEIKNGTKLIAAYLLSQPNQAALYQPFKFY
jgi:hypothetical protein